MDIVGTSTNALGNSGTTTGTYGYIEAGLPNITGTATGMFANGSAGSGALTLTSNSTSILAGNSGGRVCTLSITASNSNSIYGGSETVQPPSVLCLVKTRYI